jgi:hypothetical protein
MRSHSVWFLTAFAACVWLTVFARAADDAGGKTLVVSTAGDDGGAGTRASPLKKISAALKKVEPGDKVIVLAGKYNETITLPRSGEEGKPITLTGEGQVIIDPSSDGKDQGHGIVGRNVGYWVIEGFDCGHAVQGIKFKDCHDLIIRKCKAHDAEFGLGLEGVKADRLLYEDIEIYNNVAGGLDVNNPVAMDHVVFRRCSAHHNACKGGTDGFGISHNCTAKDVRFEYCQAFENGSDGFDLSGHKGYGVTVLGCIAHHNGTKMWGANFKCWNPGSTFINCVGWATGATNDGNFEAHGENITFIHCTSGENRDSGFAISGKNAKLINCIIADSKKHALKFYKDDKHPDVSCTADHCLFFNCGDNGPLELDRNISGDPHFADAAKGDFRIKSGSAAAGKGKAAEIDEDAAGNARLKDAPSIGAYEIDAK